jgi:hypothetical protein
VNNELQEQAVAALEADAFRPGQTMPDIYYCRHCHFSREWVASNGHTEDCLIEKVRAAFMTSDTSSGGA